MYLAEVSADWKSKVGKGNVGVVGQAKQKSEGIGYVELAFAVQKKLAWVALKNKSGNIVEPSLEAVSAAMEGVDIPVSTEVMIVNSANAKAYPIAGFT